MHTEVVNFEMPIGDFTGSLKPRPMLDRWDGETNEPVVFRGQGIGLERRKRFPIPYTDEGPSNQQHGFFHGYAEQKRIHHDYGGPSRVEILENERVELIRKLDELKDQIIRCGDLTEKPRRRLSPPPLVHSNNYFGDDYYMHVSPTRLYNVNMQPSAPDKYILEPRYFSPNNQAVCRTNRRSLDVQDFSSPQREISNEIVVYDSSNLPQRPRRPPYQPPPQYLMQPYHDHFYDRSTLISRQHETFSTQIACSCLQCYNTNRKIPSQVPPTLYDSKESNWSLENFVTRNPKTISSIEIDLWMGGVAHRDPRRVVAVRGSERVCHPVLGGAPFLSCCSCFELLKLPRKLVVMGKNQQRVQCGACSAILLVEFGKKRVIVTVSQVPKQVLAEGDDGSGEKLSQNLRTSKNHSNAFAMDSWSDEFNNSGCKFPVTDTDVTKPNVLSSDQSLNFSKTIERKESLSSASSFSEDQHSTDTVTCRREISISSTVPLKDDVPLPLSDSLDQNKPNYDSSSYVLSRYEDQEKLILNRSTSQQSSVEDVSVATEIPSHKHLNSSMSRDSAVVRKEHHPRINEVVRNVSTVYFSFSNQSVETERSDDFDNLDYVSPLRDTEVSEVNVLSSDQRQNFVESIERKEPLSSTSSFSENEHSQDDVIIQRNIFFSKVPPKDDGPLPLSDYLDQNEPNDDNPSNMVRTYEGQQKVILNRSIPQQNTVENVSVATEIEVPPRELLDSRVSQYSAVATKAEDLPRINKLKSNASTVYFSFSSRSMETERLNDFENSDYEVSEANVFSSDQRQNFVESIERNGPLSSTSRFTEDEHSPDNVIFQRDVPFSSFAPRKDDGPMILSDSLDQNEPSNYFSSNMVSRYEDQKRVILNKSTPQQNSVEDVSVETEIEVPSRKLLDSSVSQDSAAVRKEEDCTRINKWVSNTSTVYFSGSSGSVETERPKVYVNGQPISDRAVKMAENLAGPIKPGNYWYDYQGGFWGVMGQPCLGIIPPFIEEFRYPMPEDCAAGNTGVFVNGRELNQKDLDLLAGRGLPTTRDRYYVVEICGTVLDENTGEKLRSLGKLAPTVRRTNQGFGMKTPRALAQ